MRLQTALKGGRSLPNTGGPQREGRKGPPPDQTPAAKQRAAQVMGTAEGIGLWDKRGLNN